MRHRYRTSMILAWAATILAALPCLAATPAERSPVHGPVPHRFSEGRSATGIPFRLERGNIYLPVTIDGWKDIELIFDTGLPAGGIYLFDTPQAKQVGGGGNGPVKLNLPGIVFPEVRLRRTAIRLDCAAAGMIGPDLLGSCVVEIDYARSVINLHAPEAYRPAGGTTELPLIFFDRSPFIEVGFSLAKGQARTATCCLDLGSAGFLHLYSHDEMPIEPPGRFITGYLGTGVDGPLHGKWARVASCRLGGFQLSNVLCAFSTARPYPGHEKQVFGNLGNGILRKFEIAFDYANNRVFLARGSDFGTPTHFHWPSGMILSRQSDGGLVVAEVFGNTDAARQGLEKGDSIVEVDGVPVDETNQGSILQSLSRQGSTVKLQVCREGKLRDVSLKLASPI